MIVRYDLYDLVPQPGDVHPLGNLRDKTRQIDIVHASVVEQAGQERLILEAVLDQAVP